MYISYIDSVIEIAYCWTVLDSLTFLSRALQERSWNKKKSWSRHYRSPNKNITDLWPARGCCSSCTDSGWNLRNLSWSLVCYKPIFNRLISLTLSITFLRKLFIATSWRKPNVLHCTTLRRCWHLGSIDNEETLLQENTLLFVS